ncbi:MAG: hypothetical protein PVH88_15175 [Ignavibacteria bacterium]|jgi:hypothetical protein
MKKILSILLILNTIIIFAQETDPGENKSLNKIQTSDDDAYGVLDKGEILNIIGNQGIISDTYYQNLIYNFRWPKSKGVAQSSSANATDDVSILFGHKGNVLDAYGRYRNEDWQAPTGALGKYHADDQPEDLLASDGAPRLAHSDIPLTWPKGYFDENQNWVDAPTGEYSSLSEAKQKIVDSKGAYYDQNNDVWRFWPGRFRIDVDPESETYGQELPGEFAADREVYAISTDHNAQLPSTEIGLTLELQAYSYGRRFAEDIHFYDFTVTNNSSEVLDSCWWGYYVDFQFGDSGDEVWGSYNSGINQNGYDNAFYQYDVDGPDPGNIEEGYVGMLVLATPFDLGITDGHFFRDLSGSVTPADDEQMWPVMISDPDNPNITASNYFHGSNVKFDDFSLTEPGKDPGVQNWTMFVTTGPFTLQPGESFRSTMAFGFGEDLEDLQKNFTTAQSLYLNEFVGPAAPPSPTLSGVAGDNKVTLYWDDSALDAVDPSSKQKDFEGYKIYRSQDQGSTWGEQITDNQGSLVGYVPVAQFDKDNLIQGTDPINNYNYLGDNTGIVHTYVDTTVYNGVNYSYTITAYDSGSVTSEVESLESARGTTAADNNLVDVTPRSGAIGYISGSATIEQISSTGNGEIDLQIINPDELTGADYLITFNASPADSFYLINNNTKRVLTTAALNSEDMVVTDGLVISITGDETSGEVVSILDGDANNVEGEDNSHPDDNWYVEVLTTNGSAELSSQGADYQFRFTDEGSFVAGLTGQNKPLIKSFEVPFEIWNVSIENNPFKINAIVLDNNGNNQYDPSEEIRIVNEPYVENDDTLGIFSLLKWYYSIKIDTIGSNGSLPAEGDTFTIESTSQFSIADSFFVTIIPPSVDKTSSTVNQELSEVRVVPNPYLVNAAWEQTENTRRLRFMFLPPECTISIFTVRGELVKKIYHDNGTGDEDWNLTNESGVEIAYGLYIYYLETPNGGNTIGKFAIIK